MGLPVRFQGPLPELLRSVTAAEGGGRAMPKTMLVFAHPDDETIALGARMGRFREGHLVQVTDGAPRNEQDSRKHGFPSFQAYGAAREEELARALGLAGLATMSRESLGIPDQEASLHLEELTRRVEELLEQHRPAAVFTHPYEGGHPDHDACAFAVHHAVARWERAKAPLIVEAPFYHAGEHGFRTGSFLIPREDAPEAVYTLSAEEQERKRALIACFTTQQETLREFSMESECFRIAPQYDFRRPPHPPPVLYDRFPWGMRSERFCELAREAEDALAKPARQV